MLRLGLLMFGLVLVGGATFWVLTRPILVDPATLADQTGDVERGRIVFAAAGCGSCHTAPGAPPEDRLVLSGGQRFETPFGTFLAPNISSDPVHGVGAWSVTDLANAVIAGVSPDGAHYYPVFPWDSYRLATPGDVADLHAYMATLPASATPSAAHDLPLPFRFRRGIGLWKGAFARSGWVVDGDDLSEAELRGRYLVEGLGHCAECHTPRNSFGAVDTARWLHGGPDPADPTGKGTIPGLTPSQLDWSEGDIAAYLLSGFTPDYDSAGGHMALVIGNTAQLPDADRAAIAAYLKRVPAAH
jgi:mono/diheme cytochrome c family protein